MTEIREDYTEAEIARLTKNSKKERWAVTLVFEDETMHTTKWYTSKGAAKRAVLAYLSSKEYLTNRKVVNKLFLSNQAGFNEEFDDL